MSRRRLAAGSVLASSALALSLLGGVAAAADTAAEWQPAPGFPVTVDGLTVSFETATFTSDPWGIGTTYLDPLPAQRLEVVNDSERTRVVGYGIDIDVQGEIEPLWNPDTFAGLIPEAYTVFATELAPGQRLSDTESFLATGVPVYPGRTPVVYELSEMPAGENDPAATELARSAASGGFVPIRFDAEATGDGVPPVGQRIQVIGPDGPVEEPDLFPGVTGTVAASGLPPDLPVELWIAPNFDYFFFTLLGSNLPADARQVGAATTAADGTVSTTFTVPADAQLDTRYQLIMGVRAERFWPAGTYGGFRVTAPEVTSAVTVGSADTQAVLDLGVTQVSFGFAAGQGEGTWSATQSATGPLPQGFQLAGSAQLYYHLDTTATLTQPVTVCIDYDEANVPGTPPRLFHFTDPPGGWTDITVSRTPGRVCGSTTSLSPFALGYPADDGSTAPPARGVLSDDNGWDTGLEDGDYNVTMTLRRGENARYVRLLENGEVVAEQQLVLDSPRAQRAVFPIAGKGNGSYTYVAELENSRGITTTAPLTVKVTEATPSKVVLKASNPRNGSFTLTADMWWGTNATSYRFLEGTTEIASGTLTAATPNAQRATHTVTGKGKGTYTFTVEFINAAGTTVSAPLTVRVK